LAEPTHAVSEPVPAAVAKVSAEIADEVYYEWFANIRVEVHFFLSHCLRGLMWVHW
jgi:hypothetical protein